MVEWLKHYIDQLKSIWENIDRKARIIIGVSMIVVFSILLFLIIWPGDSNYKPLFSNLSSKDASAIVERLESTGIPYKIDNNGTEVQVPEAQVHKTRLDIAGAGLPSQGVVGFEIFDNSSFGTTDFERKVNFYRAVGGELSRSIQTMAQIEYAKVQITAPKESLFVEEEKPAKASVLIKLGPGVSLSNSQVKAISNLVAGSVQELETDGVTIVDTKGNLLTASLNQEADINDQFTLNKLNIQKQFENNLKNDLTIMLTKVLGPDNFSLNVNAKLNFDQQEVQTKTYSPVVDDEGIIRSEEIMEETYEGINSDAGGVPGTSSNLPQYQGENEDNSESNYEKTDTVTNYEINEKIEKHIYSPGEVENISVSLIVNNSFSEETLEKVEETVAAAIGNNNENGNIVSVTSLPFDRSLEEEIEEARMQAEAEDMRQTYIYAGLIALISLILFIIIMVTRRKSENTSEQNLDLEAETELEQAKTEVAPELSEEEQLRKEMREKLEDLVYEQPEGVAEVLKSWLMEE